MMINIIRSHMAIIHVHYIMLYRYDPRMNTWHSVVAMNERRSGLGLSIVNNTLYSVGGFNGSCYLKSVEWLDLNGHQWKAANSMNYRRLGCGVGMLLLPSNM